MFPNPNSQSQHAQNVRWLSMSEGEDSLKLKSVRKTYIACDVITFIVLILAM